MRRTVYLLVTIDLDDDDDRTADEIRDDTERQLSGDLAEVTLLARTGDERSVAAPDGEPAAQHHDADARQRTAYLAAVIRALMRHDTTVQPHLSPICPECDEVPEPEDGLHVVLGAAVVIGCEGYWVIDPNLVGIHRPTWQPLD
jgi:hypothetical protein